MKLTKEQFELLMSITNSINELAENIETTDADDLEDLMIDLNTDATDLAELTNKILG